MLLTDGNPNTTEDLRVYESAILTLAHTETIDLNAKLGLATEEVAQEVLDFVLNRSAIPDPKAGQRRELGVSDVVVTRQLKRWHALHTLEVVYRDGFHNQLNDRYKEKFVEYREQAKRAREQALMWGVGLVFTPVPRATVPEVGSVVGALAGAVYWVRNAWVSGSGQIGAASEMTTFMTDSGSVLTVASGEAPEGVTGFHVYVGESPDAVRQQTSSVVPVGQVFTLPGTGLISGEPAGDGQSPDVYLTAGNVLRRG